MTPSLQRSIQRLMFHEVLRGAHHAVRLGVLVVGAMVALAFNASTISGSQAHPAWYGAVCLGLNALALLVSLVVATRRSTGQVPGSAWSRAFRLLRRPGEWAQWGLPLDQLSEQAVLRITWPQTLVVLVCMGGCLAMWVLGLAWVVTGIRAQARAIAPAPARPGWRERWAQRLLREHPDLVVTAEAQQLRQALAEEPGHPDSPATRARGRL